MEFNNSNNYTEISKGIKISKDVYYGKLSNVKFSIDALKANIKLDDTEDVDYD